MSAIPHVTRGVFPPDADAAVRLLYSRHADAVHAYVVRFCPERASADDIVQEPFIRTWRHLPQLTADDRPVRPLSLPHRTMQVGTFYCGDTIATAA